MVIVVKGEPVNIKTEICNDLGVVFVATHNKIKYRAKTINGLIKTINRQGI